MGYRVGMGMWLGGGVGLRTGMWDLAWGQECEVRVGVLGSGVGLGVQGRSWGCRVQPWVWGCRIQPRDGG